MARRICRENPCSAKNDNALGGEPKGVAYIVKDSWGPLKDVCTSDARLTPDENALTIPGADRSAAAAVSLQTALSGPRKSLRKEVIQPQVLLRLPCYDLVPVTDLAVDTTEKWRLRALPAPMT